MFEEYKGKVVQVFGGHNTYLGELDTEPHPNGKWWYRLKNPCAMQNEAFKDGHGYRLHLMALSGMEKMYCPYVDLRYPDDLVLEIRTLDDKGALYAKYKEEIGRKLPDRILTVNDPRLGKELHA